MCWFITLPETVLRALLNLAELCNTPVCWTFSLFLAACRAREAGKQLALASAWQKMLAVSAALVRGTLGLDCMCESSGEDSSQLWEKRLG